MKIKLGTLRKLIREEVENVMGKNITIELDIALDDEDMNLQEYIRNWENKFNVKANIIAKEGPSGWPQVQFTGTEANLKALFAEYNAGDITDFDIHIISQ